MKLHVSGPRVLFQGPSFKISAFKSLKIVAGLTGRVGVDILLWLLSHFDDLTRFQVILLKVLPFFAHAEVVVFGINGVFGLALLLRQLDQYFVALGHLDLAFFEWQAEASHA